MFGRSATGGAVLFTTQKPTDTFGGYVQGTAGNYATGRFEGAVNVPIVEDKVLLRVAGLYQRRHDGYQYNLFNGQDAGTTEREGARASLTLNFSERLRNDLVGHARDPVGVRALRWQVGHVLSRDHAG